MRQTNTRNYVLTALFAALTAVLSQIQLPLGPVPFNLGVLGAILAGMLLPPVWAATSLVVYMLMGAIGLPVFAGFAGGPAILFGATGGYIVGYIAIALFTAVAMQRKASMPIVITAMVFGVAICYALGTAWFMFVTGNDLVTSLGWCVIPFIVPDLGKCAFGYMIGKTISNRLVTSHA